MDKQLAIFIKLCEVLTSMANQMMKYGMPYPW